MNSEADLLLYWLSHLGSASIHTLRSAIASLMGDGVNEDAKTRFLRTYVSRLRQMAHIADPMERLCITAPRLSLLPGEAAVYNDFGWVLCGARTPRLLNDLEREANLRGCHYSAEVLRHGPSRITLVGELGDVMQSAHEVGIAVVTNEPIAALTRALDIPGYVDSADVCPTPNGVEPEIFDLHTGQWTARPPQFGDACRFKPRYERPTYYSLTSRGYIKFADGGEAVFAAAYLRRSPICQYDANSREVRAPILMPKHVAQAFCLCSGRPPIRDATTFTVAFSNVSPSIAHVAFAKLGQDRSTEPQVQIDVTPENRTIYWIS